MNSNKKKKTRHAKIKEEQIILVINSIFVFGIILFLSACLIRSIIRPKKILDGENRYAEQYSDINFKNFMNKKAQDKIESVLSDQLILSGRLRSYNNMIKATTVKQYFNLFLTDNDFKYLNSDGIAFYGKKNLVYYYRDLDKLKESLDNKANNYNELIKNHKNTQIYFYYIEKDTDINFLTNEKVGIYEYLEEKLNTKNISKFKINNFEEYKKYFYETDHHWNYIGSYKGYKEVLKLLGINDQPLIGDKKCLNIYWSGSKAGQSIYKNILKENFCAYKFDYGDMKITINGKENDYGQQKQYFEKNHPKDISYGKFYGWDDGEIIFDTNNESKDNIMIIGESYDNAILKLLAKHFNKTISIDLRNYKAQMGKDFNFEQYLKEYNIQKVLFIGNVDFYTMSEFMIEGGK